MITVMINSIMFGSEYEFRFDADTEVSELIEEIGEMICQREQCELIGDVTELVLFSKETQAVLKGSSTLRECGIRTGDTLYFG